MVAPVKGLSEHIRHHLLGWHVHEADLPVINSLTGEVELWIDMLRRLVIPVPGDESDS